MKEQYKVEVQNELEEFEKLHELMHKHHMIQDTVVLMNKALNSD